jgi:hypothetical protein
MSAPPTLPTQLADDVSLVVVEPDESVDDDEEESDEDVDDAPSPLVFGAADAVREELPRLSVL